MEELRRKLKEDHVLYDNVPLQPDIDRKFGQIPGVEVGTLWPTRDACAKALVHTPHFAGISGHPSYGAYSVVLSGAYEDDHDEGETFIYTGTGGRTNDDAAFGGAGPQTEDQYFEHPDNMALKTSVSTKRPVRVVRGANNKSRFAPATGYRYDGLYLVESAFMDKGKSGFMVCRYAFRRVKDGQPPLPRN